MEVDSKKEAGRLRIIQPCSCGALGRVEFAPATYAQPSIRNQSEW